MDCPFCSNAMQRGEIHGDIRAKKVGWAAENRYETTPLAKAFSASNHLLRNITYKSGFWIRADYCPTCKKMIFDADIEEG